MARRRDPRIALALERAGRLLDRVQGLLVQTGDGVREPQNRRVEIVIQ